LTSGPPAERPSGPATHPAADLPPPREIGVGRFDCPTVESPPYTLDRAAAGASPTYRRTCATCHGPRGEGRPGYPAIAGKLSLDDFRRVVRAGRGLMPRFGVEEISDDVLAADHAALEAGGEVAVAGAGPAAWSSAEVDLKIRGGLVAFRQPDAHGTACANCHAPDGIDLALIGYPDDAIMRRGGLHLPPERVVAIIDMIHALRRKYAIDQPCSTTWRIFQPGGRVLPGATVQERELAFADELDRRRWIGRIASPADARAARERLLAADLRRLPIGIALPRWTDDPFHGPSRRDFNDWIPGLGRIPRDPTAWYASIDAYLADPSDERMAAIDAKVESMTTVGEFDALGRRAPTQIRGTNWLENAMRMKYQGVLLASHLFRMELLGRASWLDRGRAVPFPTVGRRWNPFLNQGLQQAESPCYDSTCEAQFIESAPEFVREEVVGEKILQLTKRMSDGWSTLGQLLDQGLLASENTRGQTFNAFYWNLFTFEHDKIHQPFFTAHRLLTQDHYLANLRGTAQYPRSHVDLADVKPALGVVRPLLHATWLSLQGIGEIDGAVERREDPRFDRSYALRIDLVRLIALTQLEYLDAGASTYGDLERALDRLFDAPRLLRRWLDDPRFAKEHPLFANDREYYVDGPLELEARLRARLQTAPRVD
jgi:mono/diheme cytochrome c family protein